MNTSESCLDAETLAAWVDGGLSGDELRMVQSHVADCARCQSLVGAMGRTDAPIPPPEPVRAPRRWLAWAVPLAAAATAVVIWTTVPRNTATIPAPVSESARSAAAPEPEIIVSPEVIPEKSDEAAERKPASSPPTVRPQPAESRDQLAESVTVAPQQEARKDVAAAAPPAAAAAAPAPLAARARTDNFAISAPKMQQLCGASWTGPAPSVTTPLTAGSSPSAGVCWVVGRLGVVLVTTDGRTWRGITFPVITDLSSVTATDARIATVKTADGHAFTTVDGGATWRGN